MKMKVEVYRQQYNDKVERIFERARLNEKKRRAATLKESVVVDLEQESAIRDTLKHLLEAPVFNDLDIHEAISIPEVREHLRNKYGDLGELLIKTVEGYNSVIENLIAKH